MAFATADALEEAAILALPRGAGLALRDPGALGGLALDGRGAPALRWIASTSLLTAGSELPPLTRGGSTPERAVYE